MAFRGLSLRLALLFAAVCCSSAVAFGDEWSDAGSKWGLSTTDTVTIDVAGAGRASYTTGDLISQKPIDGALVIRMGVAVCLGGKDNSPGIVAGASTMIGSHPYGSLELGASICRQVGGSTDYHTYLTGQAGSLRIGNVESDQVGAHLGELITIVRDPAGLKKGQIDGSLFLGMLENVYYGRDGEEPQSKDFAVGGRLKAMYRDLVHRLEVTGQVEVAANLKNQPDLSADADASVRWLAIRLPNTESFLYVGLQGDLLYARNMIPILDSSESSTGQSGPISQFGAQGSGLIGFEY